MSLKLSAAALLEMHKIAGDTAWIVLVEVTVPATPATTIRLCNNNEDVTWDGETWTAFPFEIDSVDETGKGEIPSATLRVSNVTQEIQSIIEDVSGGADMPVTLRVVNSGHLDEASPEIELDFIVTGCKYDAYWITFTLGGDAKLTRRVPERRHLKDFCPFQYGGIECGVASATMTVYTGCLKTLAQCRERSNSTRFGGEPGMPQGGFYASV
jgi:lambda family phage minor tail protein L